MSVRFSGYGLTFATSIPVTVPAGAAIVGAPDVTVLAGEAPAASGLAVAPGVSRAAGGEALVVDTHAAYGLRFAVTTDRIVVDHAADSEIEGVWPYILGTALPVLLHLRGAVPLHANVLLSDEGVVAILGRSGAGKSTTSAALLELGWRLLTDDTAVASITADGRVEVAPGLPRLKLWPAATELVPIDVSSAPAGDHGFPKHDLDVADRHSRRPVRPDVCVVLAVSDDVVAPQLERLDGAVAVRELLGQLTRPALADAIGDMAAQFRVLTQLAASAPVAVLWRPPSGDHVTGVVEAVQGFLREVRP